MKKFIFFILIIFSSAQAQDVPGPVSGSYVHDFAEVMTENQRSELHQRLIQLKKKYTIETAIVTIKTTDGYPIEDYSMKIGREWGVGGKSNNGLVIIAAIYDRKWRIDVGYGLEGDLTDAGSKSLAEEFMVPRFKESNYYQGFFDLINEIDKEIDPATKALIKAEKEKRALEWEKKKQRIWDFFVNLFFFLLSIGLVILIWRWRKEIIAKKERELKEAIDSLEVKRQVLTSLLNSINDVLEMTSTEKEKEDVNNIWKKYRDFYRESGIEIDKGNDIRKIKELTENFPILSKDASIVRDIRNNLLIYEDLKNKNLSYNSINSGRESILRSFKTQKLLNYLPEFEEEYAKQEGEQKKIFEQLDKIKSEFEYHLEKERDLKSAIHKFEKYQNLLSKAQKTNDHLFNMVSRGESDKKFVAGFDKSVDFYLKGVLGIATLSYISDVVRNQTISHAKELEEKSLSMEKSPENIGALRKFMDGIDKGFMKLFAEKEKHDRKVREEKEKKEREDEEERRRKRKKQEEEDEERRRRNSYSSYSSYDSYSSSSSSSSSSSDSYSGGSFGGGGSSGDW